MMNREGELLLFDCGEGAQQQMMRAKTGLSISSIFITHWHGDHFLGIPGLVQTLSFQGRREPLEIFGPEGIEKFVHYILSLGYYRLRFEVRTRKVKAGDVIKRGGYEIIVVETDHSIPSVCYVLNEERRLGRFNPEKAMELEVKPGPLFSKLHHGESVFVKGREIKPDEVVGPPRPGRKIVYTGDTRPCTSVIEASKDADLMIHDGMFCEDLRDWAIESKHSTAAEAADIAKQAGAKQLVLTHISSRYSESVKELLKEAKGVFENTIVARDRMVIEIPYPD
jgi:ribonuclease Z